MYEIIYYSTETDNSPVESFLNDLNKKAKVKVMAGNCGNENERLARPVWSKKRSQTMTREKFRTFQDHLDEELKDPEFREMFENDKMALAIAMQIVELRESLGLSQLELAEKMGTSQQTISRLESGDYDGFTFKTLDKIARATGTILHIEFLQKAS